ncbi:McrC family protein [Novosphingobium sp. BL-52-GroH]|uniref:McrC family protein n=1 Tax=Novosphingobium sp. BL-52-GroH TaxID=3349877 RepID=UPI00384BA067
MTHRAVCEWGKVAVGRPGGFTEAQARALMAAASTHPLGGADGGAILSDHRHHLRAKQMVGVLAAPGCSLEILPKVDPEAPDEDAPTVRRRLVSLIDLALGLDIGDGGAAAMAHGADSLLEVLIRLFAERLLAQTRRGLPRQYLACEDDLPALRGRLDVTRQFTVNAVRPDRLACRFDVLSHDIALMRIMAATVVSLGKRTRVPATRRLLDELRFVLADVTLLPPSALPWSAVRIDRTNHSWQSLFRLARLLMGREWQATGHDAAGHAGTSLLFPMERLFEDAVAALLRRSLANSDIEVVAQGGLRHCLGDWHEDGLCQGAVFQTRPDLLLRRRGKVIAVIDTKWKRLCADPLDRKHGVSQADVYQMMAYARLYECERLMLLYPAAPGAGSGEVRRFGVHGGREMIALGRVALTGTMSRAAGDLAVLVGGILAERRQDSRFAPPGSPMNALGRTCD